MPNAKAGHPRARYAARMIALVLFPFALAADPSKLTAVDVALAEPPAEAARWLGATAAVAEGLHEELAERALDGGPARLDVTVASIECRVRQASDCTVTARFVLSGDPAHTLDRTVTTRASAAGPDAARFASRSALRSALITVLDEGPFDSLPPGAVRDAPPTWTGPLTVAACAPATLVLPRDLPVIMSATGTVRHARGNGSGVVVSPDGYVLTAAHVVTAAQGGPVTLRLADGVDRPATIVRLDAYQDVALLKVTSEVPMACASPAVSGTQLLGLEVFAVGSPLRDELSGTVSKGIVSGNRTIEDRAYVQTDAPVNPGNSGGPLVDLSGHVVGILVAKVIQGEGIGFAVPVDRAVTRLELVFGPASDPTPSPGLRGRGGGSTRALAPASPPTAATPPAGAPTQTPTVVVEMPVPGDTHANVRYGLGVGAAVGITTGATLIGTTWLLHVMNFGEPPTPANVAVNTVGWGLLIGGAGCGVGALLLEDTGLRIGPGYLGVEGRF